MSEENKNSVQQKLPSESVKPEERKNIQEPVAQSPHQETQDGKQATDNKTYELLQEVVRLFGERFSQDALIAKQNRPNWWMVALTAGLVLIGLASNIFTCRQITSFEKTTNAGLRPFLVISEPVGRQDSIEGGVQWNIKNVGNTPAYSVAGVSRVIFTDKPDTLPRPQTLKVGDGDWFIPPHDQIETWDSHIIMKDPEKGPDVNKEIFVVIGRIEYYDSFGKFHWTNFGYRYIWLHKRFVPYLNFNDADRDY